MIAYGLLRVLLCASECVCFVALHPHYVTVTALLLWCQACKWVMGSVRRWQTRWGCEASYRDRESPEPGRYLVPSELFKGCLTAAGQSGPGSTTLRTGAAAFDRLSDCQHTLFWFISSNMSCCGYPCVVQETPVLAQDVYSKLSQTWELLVLAGHSGSGAWQVPQLYNCVTVCFIHSHQHSCCAWSLCVSALLVHCSVT